MRSSRLIKRAICSFAMGVSLCLGLLGNVGSLRVEAQEETDIGSAVAIEEAVEAGDFADEASMVDASYTAVTATYDFSTAYAILDILNQERNAAGLSSLTMDKDLLEAAMFRGAEISECWSHTRPNGKSCFSICSKCYAENIAYGYGSASAVMNGWMNSSGHKANMMNANYTTVGIGAVIVNGSKYYVQVFGYGNLNKVPSKPSNQTVTVNVPTSSDAATVFPTIAYSSTLPTYTDSETVFPDTDITVSYTTHIQSFGWSGTDGDTSDWESNGGISGTLGLSKRLEGIKISVDGNADLGIRYKTHIQSYGWESAWKTDGAMSGTSGESKRLEAIMIELTGADKANYDVYYRVHAQTYGWLGWAKNGAPAGTAGQSKRLEAIQIIVVPKGEAPSGILGYSYIELGKTADNGTHDGLINYSTHVQTYGDQSYVYDGSVSGTFGEAKRLEGIRININNDLLGYEGGVRYTTHVQTYGWQGDPDGDGSDWKTNGVMSGTSGESKRLEAICIELYGDVANYYDVYYRVHSQTFGWLGWAKNGDPAGTAGYAKRLEGIQIVLLPKGSVAPSVNPGVAGTSAYIEK